MLTKRKIKFILLFVLILNSLFLFTNVYSKHISEDYLSQKQELKEAIDLYEKGKYPGSIIIFEKLAKLGNPVAEGFYAKHLRYGSGVKEDEKEAQKIFKRVLPKIRKIAEQGDDLAQYLLGYIYGDILIMSEIFCPEKFNRYNAEYLVNCHKVRDAYMLESPEWYKKSAKQGNVHAQYGLGEIYYFGKHEIEKNYKEALKWYQKASEQGLVDAQFRLGHMYYLGEGVEKNYKEAFKIIDKLVKEEAPGTKGNIWNMKYDIRYYLGLMYYNGHGTLKNFQKALEYFKESASNGNDEALNWLKKSAEQGDPDVQYELGYMYSMGKGVEKNEKESFKWIKKSADQGNTKSQVLLGLMYYLGQGVEKDYSEAFKWLNKGAEKGHVKAGFFLGSMYENGYGTLKDEIEAYKWMSLACRDLSASENYSDDCKQNLDRLESKLTKSERDEALKRAKEFLNTSKTKK